MHWYTVALFNIYALFTVQYNTVSFLVFYDALHVSKIFICSTTALIRVFLSQCSTLLCCCGHGPDCTDSVISTVTWLRDGKSRVRIREGVKRFFPNFQTGSGVPTSPLPWVPGILSQEVKWFGWEAKLSPPLSVGVKNKCSCTTLHMHSWHVHRQLYLFVCIILHSLSDFKVAPFKDVPPQISRVYCMVVPP